MPLKEKGLSCSMGKRMDHLALPEGPLVVVVVDVVEVVVEDCDVDVDVVE